MSYKITGNKIPVTKDELINYTHKQLQLYDTGKLKDINPYTQQVIYITKDGKMIQVPQDIQKEAVASWKPQARMPVMQIKKEVDEEAGTGQTDYLTIGILILAAILAIYLFNKTGLISNTYVNPNTRYYLTR